MKNTNKISLDNSPLSNLNENINIVISSDDINPKGKKNKKIIEDDANIKISIDIDGGETPEKTIVSSEKKKLRKSNVDLLNEEIDELFKKHVMTFRRTKPKNIDPVLSKKRKRLRKHKKDIDEDFTLTSDEDDETDKKVNVCINNDTDIHRDDNNIKDENESNLSNDDEELMEFINKKRLNKQKLNIYKELYDKKKKKKNRIEILFGDIENYNLNYINENINNDKSEVINDEKKNDETDMEIRKHKHLKKLKKNTDNKEMELPLDAECIICCCVIDQLANPDECNHNFCKNCLIEWSQRSGKCPMCKKIFNNIYTYDDGIKKKISLNEIRNKFKKEKKKNENVEDIEKICYVCGKDSDQSNVLTCDRCKNNFCHYYCIKLNKKPEGKWNCKFCKEELKDIRENKKKIGRFFL
jgi:hypothetical protein